MSRSRFLQTLAALLAGAHTAGPVSLGGLPGALRRCLPAPRTAAPPRPTPSPAACR